MPESGQHDPHPRTVVNMEQANPLLGQWKIMKNKEHTFKHNRVYVNKSGANF